MDADPDSREAKVAQFRRKQSIRAKICLGSLVLLALAAAAAYLVPGVPLVAILWAEVIAMLLLVVNGGTWALSWIGFATGTTDGSIRIKRGAAQMPAPPSPAPQSAAPPAAPAPSTDDQIIEIAQRVVAPATDVTHYFICSGNASLVAAFQGLLRVGTPAYGGSAAEYRTTSSALSSRKAEAASVPFRGQSFMGSRATDVATVAEVLSGLEMEAMSGACSIAYAKVGPTGVAWVHEVYDTLLTEAMGQGILPFPMYVTSDPAAASYVLDSIR